MPQAEEAALAGPEGRAGTDDHRALRVWLLSSSLQIEGEIRKRLPARRHRARASTRSRSWRATRGAC